MENITPRTLRLCVIENGLVPAELRNRFASYPAMIKHWLSPSLPEAVFSQVSPVSGEPLPDPATFDGYILTGSKHSCYEGTLWMEDLKRFLQQLREQRRPVFGICFGHQIMADAYGGRTRRAEQGWGVGAQPYQYADSVPAAGAAFVFHQDQVVDLPPGAEVLGGSSHCRQGVLGYPFPALSVQYHPEFPPSYVEALARRYSGNLLPRKVADTALSSLERIGVDNTQIAAWVASFFREHGAPAVIESQQENRA
ncbi:type 1 glutamine amidotransferase [Oceanimonas doudoroffii]|uniref:type 1 glutamine amidotransferase n=1 Tax=Oceanimonas doudoroffii TaxID=84158 RepID=UPI001B7FF35E|nr:type 1 glutamine amidotransferase [Oceanimonas doudoroffii]